MQISAHSLVLWWPDQQHLDESNTTVHRRSVEGAATDGGLQVVPPGRLLVRLYSRCEGLWGASVASGGGLSWRCRLERETVLTSIICRGLSLSRDEHRMPQV